MSLRSSGLQLRTYLSRTRCSVLTLLRGAGTVSNAVACDGSALRSNTACCVASGERTSAPHLLGLIIHQPCHLIEPVLVGRAGQHVADALVGPEQRAVLVLRGVAHLRIRRVRARGVQRVALAVRALIHEERGGRF